MKKITFAALALLLILSVALFGTGQPIEAQAGNNKHPIHIIFADYDSGYDIIFWDRVQFDPDTEIWSCVPHDTPFSRWVSGLPFSPQPDARVVNLEVDVCLCRPVPRSWYDEWVFQTYADVGIRASDGRIITSRLRLGTMKREYFYLSGEVNFLPTEPFEVTSITGIPGVELEVVKTETTVSRYGWGGSEIRVHVRTPHTAPATYTRLPSAPDGYSLFWVAYAYGDGHIILDGLEATGIPGVEIIIYRYGVPKRTLTTDSDGAAIMYFDDMAGISARITVPDGWRLYVGSASRDLSDFPSTVWVIFRLERIGDAEARTPFADVTPTAWYFNYVSTVNELGLMTGTGDRQFSPNGTVTHAQAITTLWRDAGEPGATAGGTWYSDAVAWARANGVPLTFNPNEPITRRSIAALFFWYAEYADIELLPIREYTGFGDVQGDANIRSLYRAGILNGMGDGSFAPQGNTIRSQFAALLTRLLTD